MTTLTVTDDDVLGAVLEIDTYVRDGQYNLSKAVNDQTIGTVKVEGVSASIPFCTAPLN